MPLNLEQKSRRAYETREAATAFVEDLVHLRDILRTPFPSRRTLREMSNSLRRLLVNREIIRVADPRIGRVLLSAPDLRPVHRLRGVIFYCSGFPNEKWGDATLSASKRIGNLLVMLEDQHAGTIITDRVDLRLDHFLSQKVLCVRDAWVTRSQVIQYVANVASGVHSKVPKIPFEMALAEMRRIITINTDDMTFSMDISADKHGVIRAPTSFEFRRGSIDIVLLELFSIAYYLAISPAIIYLEDVINRELV